MPTCTLITSNTFQNPFLVTVSREPLDHLGDPPSVVYYGLSLSDLETGNTEAKIHSWSYRRCRELDPSEELVLGLLTTPK